MAQWHIDTHTHGNVPGTNQKKKSKTKKKKRNDNGDCEMTAIYDG